ncbi:DUF6950 family protein [Cupriavidus sp. RAF12]|uniref:DUF6950 family protein n=1 Tax=Cupriavidus sp. RAF12 TaxID=3233050 RepID=UPI003F927780
MQRIEDWPQRLADFVEARRARAFVWGESDCCLFVCDGVEAITGIDPAARWRGLYATEKGARRILNANGGVMGVAMLVFGSPVPAALAGRGDVVLVDSPSGCALALCIGNLLAAQGANGIEFLPNRLGRMAWKV